VTKHTIENRNQTISVGKVLFMVGFFEYFTQYLTRQLNENMFLLENGSSRL